MKYTNVKRKPQIKDQYCYPNRDPNYIQKGKILIFQNLPLSTNFRIN